MNDSVARAAERAITTMHDKLGEPVTVDDMARAAMFSKFHFTRMFQRATGVSPARFLSALRLQRAKHLLTSTSLTVVDISILVGYNSVGTFSSRFSRSVGLSPTDYRRQGGHADRIRLCDVRGGITDAATVHGVIRPHHDRHGLVFAGLFPECVPEGRPVRCAVLDGPGAYRFENVPPGRWYLLAQSVADVEDGFDVEGRGGLGGLGGHGGHGGLGGGPGGPGARPLRARDPRQAALSGDGRVSVGTVGPLVVRRGAGDLVADLQLKPAGVLDPPVLLALLDARRAAVARVAAVAATGVTVGAGAV
ncbi:AraC family transcriptional regulator [Catenulispora subtropica]|uniref:HTH araC/xylS-type domain-containing protein n=1 Tax=Catenulispora subtropica TaxID=450798 RepID=A0ABP5ELR6_9ACTN